jgi:hypothetical protein
MIDIKLNNALDLVEDDDTLDWVEDTSDLTNQHLLLITEKGEWKENPGVGVGAAKWLEHESSSDFTREIRKQFSADGMQVNSVVYNNGNLKIDAPYRS